MSFLDGIKDYFADKMLNRELKGYHHTPTIFNFSNATKVALLYKGDDEASFRSVQRYVKYLKDEEGIRHIMALGYYDLKETPDYLQSQIEFDYFTRNDVNWYRKPTSRNVEHFVEKDYDILIDLSANQCTPLKYTLLKSKAKFKVGRYSKENEVYYDLMINVSEKVNMATYIKSINHYLALLKQDV